MPQTETPHNKNYHSQHSAVVESFPEFQEPVISPDHSVANRIGNVAVISFTESLVPNPRWAKVVKDLPGGVNRTLSHEVGYDRLYVGKQKESEWIAFQGNLTPEELTILPEIFGRGGEIGPIAGNDIADAQEKVTEKVIDPGEGSIWLPKMSFDVAVPTDRELPASLTLDTVSSFPNSYLSTNYDYPEPQFGEKFSLGGGYGGTGSDIEFVGTEDEEGALQDAYPAAATINPAALIEGILSNSTDVRDLWYGHGDKGLYAVALDMARTAGRMVENIATQKDKEDLLIQAGMALDLLEAQKVRLSLEKNQQDIINGKKSAF